ncbi:LysR substrate-binding domain-containing protein [Curvivirga aplysinae]|uniref:LysR substrate-binding domain-containing protein n=1 Tax=Curvivirga aplysinae TaxID=2529852 RepID=UPI0012BC259A|nr:LysR substrate-binding domain-containing protein [Curvivirga aplysinae]MTI09681.1 LysR family transcriptional regulator [Curvivirga aplysinae]
MQNLRNLLPSANALFAFEAAARHKSFTQAAEELNVSQPAISHAVKLLEESLGQTLFRRSHRKIELTKEGRRFYQDVTAGLQHIYYSAQDLHVGQSSENLTISGSTLFIQFWMLPRLSLFEEAFPNVALRLHSTDRDVSLHTEGIDISIRLGDGKWSEYDVTLFAEELVYPICHPDYLKEKPSITGNADLMNHRLIYTDEPFRIRLTWDEWFRNAGIPNHRGHNVGLRFNDAEISLQATLDGHGIGLGWNHIVAPMVKRGELIRLPLYTYRSQNAMYMITPKEEGLSPIAQKARDWMMKEMASSLK